MRSSVVFESSVIETRTSGLGTYLSVMFQSENVFFAGRGASAIYASLRAIGETGKRVAMPSLVCPSIPCSVIEAGLEPLYLDIRENDLNLNPMELSNLPSDVCAVIAPHMFGHALDIETIRGICHEKGIVIIEDIAQAFGERINGKLLGTFGDITVISFHESKIIPGKGGGALIVNNSDRCSIQKIKNEIDNLPLVPTDTTIREKAISARVNTLLNESRDGNNREGEIRRIYMENLDLFKRKAETSNDVHNLLALSFVDTILNERKDRASKYRDLIDVDGIKHPKPENSPLFRYSIVIEREPKICELVTSTLRANGINASNLYYPAHLIFPDNTGRRLPVTEWVSRRIINLWMDSVADDEYIKKTADIIAMAVEKSS